MLSKLIKHEFKATARFLLPLYLILLLISIINRVVFQFDYAEGVLELIPGFFIFTYIITIFAIFAVTFFTMVLRFYKNLVTDEGYLMFTLPVKVTQLIFSKFITAFTWIIVSVACILGSLFVTFATQEGLNELVAQVNNAFDELHMAFGGNTLLVIIEMALFILSSIAATILIIYVSIAIGQLVHGHRILGSFGAYLGIYMITQFIGVIFVLIGYLVIPNFEDSFVVIKFVFPFVIIFQTLGSLVAFSITNYLFKNKLNLE